MRKLTLLILLVSVLCVGATTYTDKAAWDLLWENPSTTVTFGTRGNNATYREDRGGELLLVPSDAFSSSYQFESFWPGGGYFQAVLRGKDADGSYWVTPYASMPVISIVLPDASPFSFYTGPGSTGFVGVVPDSGEGRYNARKDRIYGLSYGYSAYVAPSPPTLYAGPDAASDPAGNEADDIGGWLGAGVSSTSADTPFAGTYHLKMTGNGGGDPEWGVLSGIESATYRVKYAFKNSTATPGAYSVRIQCGNVTDSTHTNLTYEEFTVDIVCFIPALYIQLNNINGVNYWIDNISVTKQ